MDADKIVEEMFAMHKRLKDSNPYKDLPDDCVCVIHPRHRHTLDQMSQDSPFGGDYAGYFPNLYGIPIIEEWRAPEDKFEFMSLITYYQKYPPIFPKQYSRQYIIWDNLTTWLRRRYVILKQLFRRY